MKATIIVTPKKRVLDPQGEAVKNAIHQQGMDCVTHARIGKIIELDISGTDATLTRQKLEKIALEVLSNPVIEDFRIELE